ncbi:MULTISPECIES: hypothetical protein [Streptomyces]|uniref:Uncharacterized protein n=2 Tax=Streptomyces TaxID=1883 RepID=A0ABV9IG66_9ACTN
MSTDTLTELNIGAADDAENEGWGIASASVVLLSLGVLGAYAFDVTEDRHATAELAVCRELASTWPMYAAAYAGLFATVAAVVLAGRRLLQPRRPRGPVQMAGMVLPAALLLLALQGLIMWTLYQQSPGGPVDC